jgi:hypothetical protein
MKFLRCVYAGCNCDAGNPVRAGTHYITNGIAYDHSVCGGKGSTRSPIHCINRTWWQIPPILMVITKGSTNEHQWNASHLELVLRDSVDVPGKQTVDNPLFL